MSPTHAPPAEAALAPGFMVLHGNRLEDLRELLTQFLRAQPLAPLQPEVILVQSNGMKHWLELALADEDALGICAATRLELPSAYLWQLYRAVLGWDAVPAQLPFDKDALLWRLMRLLPALAASDAVYAPLARYLGAARDGRRLYQLALQLADVLDGYQSYRADWLADWASADPHAGADRLRTSDGRVEPLAPDQAWQAALWRALRADVGQALADASRASVHARFLDALRARLDHWRAGGARPEGLPPRLVVFGISSLPMQTVQALAELGQVCQVLLLVHNPCRHYWGDIVEGHALLRAQLRRRQSAKPLPLDAALHSASHPLLASWGKQGRDYLHLLDGYDHSEQYRQQLNRIDVFVDPVADQAAPSLLQQLQSDILNLEPLPATPRTLGTDHSIGFVSAHSAQREVEVLHDRLLAWLDADPALQPRDVMVMVPDMAQFAPHIQAVFGRFAPGQPRHVPYSVADSTARQSPLVQALEQLLALPRARISLADWLGLFEVAALRQRFGLDAAEVAQLQQWLGQAGVRWGLDTRHRLAWGVPASVPGLDQNTWAFGLRRLLLGYAVGAGAPWQDTLPQGALGSLDARLMSALLAWLDAIDLTLQELSEEQTPLQWGRTLSALVARFFQPSDEAEERLLQRCLTPLEQWQQSCQDAGLDTPLPLEVVREHWLAQIEQTSLQQRFFGGGVQFGTLMPMRAIPFQIICLLGMNDGDYPRPKATCDFDLMAQSWRAGDRSRREDDRYLFLEALLSARQRLYISWQGHRASDNSAQPPSVLVAQLIEHLQAGWSPAIQPEAQPLQAFSERYFRADSPFRTYDKDWARVHETPPAAAATDDGPSAAPAPPSLGLGELQRLLRQPVEVFFRSRLRVQLEALAELQQEEEPFALDPLAQYQAGQALLQAGEDTAALQRLTLSGQLPLAAFGSRLAAELQHKADTVRERQTPWQQRYPHAAPALAIELNLGGTTLSGTLSGLRCTAEAPPAPGAPDAGWLQYQARFGAVLEGKEGARRARGHPLMALWVNHLAACASGLRLTSVQAGLDGALILPPLALEPACAVLQQLITVYQHAWIQPLPLACKTGWAYLQAQAEARRLASAQPDKEAKDPHEAAQTVFEGDFNRSGERADSAYLTRAFESYDELEADLPDWAERLYGELARQVRVAAADEVCDD